MNLQLTGKCIGGVRFSLMPRIHLPVTVLTTRNET